MNIHEYQAKQLFRDYGIAVPASILCRNIAEVTAASQDLGGNSWVVKAQVHAGGRGKVGGVKIAKTDEELRHYAADMLGHNLISHQTTAIGLPIESVLIEAPSDIKREFYLSVLLDRALGRVVFVSSIDGGMDIETVAKTNPEKIITTVVDPAAGLQGYQVRKVAFSYKLQASQIKALAQIMDGMYRLLQTKDASQIEINPIIETNASELVALDAKINFDDNALPLHPDIATLADPSQEDAAENSAKEYDLNYITLDGSIGCMVNGAGLAMATMDLVKLNGAYPANFLDVGGGTNAQKVCAAFKLILSDSKVKAILVNIFGGIVRCDIIAKGILTAVSQVRVTIPVVVRLEGTCAAEGRALLNESDFSITAAADLAEAAKLAVALAKDVA